MEAAENNHLDAVKYLLKAGALVDPKVRSLLRITVLFCVEIFPRDEPGAIKHPPGCLGVTSSPCLVTALLVENAGDTGSTVPDSRQSTSSGVCHTEAFRSLHSLLSCSCLLPGAIRQKGK